MKHVILDASNTVQNVVLWDGFATYEPGAGFRLVHIPEGILVGIGWTWDGIGTPQPPAEDAE